MRYSIHKHALIDDIICGLAGALLPLAFAPYGWHLLGLICPGLLFWKLEKTHTFSRTVFRCTLFGFGFFGFGAHWVYFSMVNYGNMSASLSGGATLLFVLALAGYFALQGAAFHLLKRSELWDGLLTFPALWALSEWLRSWAFTGFPWLLLGYSQTSSSLSGYAPVIGTLGISFLLVFCANCFVLMFSPRHRQPIYFAIIIVSIWLGGFGLRHVDWTTRNEDPVKVSLIQGNIPFQEKWSMQFIENALDRYEKMTRAAEDSTLIIWPENAVALPLDDAKSFIEKMSTFAKNKKSTIITGIPVLENNGQYSNTITTFGMDQGHYSKRHLVPFAESMPVSRLTDPLLNYLQIPHAALKEGAPNQANLPFGQSAIAPFICYEIAFSETVRKSLPAANTLLTVSDDAWFGDSVAAPQHLQIAVMRAIESRRPHLFVANRGITAIIDPEGIIETQSEPFTTSTISGSIHMVKGTTPWIMFGDWPILTIAGFILLLTYLAQGFFPLYIEREGAFS